MIEHFWQTLPGPQWFSAPHIYRVAVERAADGAVFVELGSWKGRSTVCMAVEIANSGKHIDFYAVDHWRGSLEEALHASDEDVRLNRLYEVFTANIAPVKDSIVPVRSDSAEAAARFRDGSVDFVYVDAGHTFEAVSRDLAAWWPKLRRGAIMAGDDWCRFDDLHREYGVQRAVEAFFSPLDVPIRLEAGCPNREWQQWVVTR